MRAAAARIIDAQPRQLRTEGTANLLAAGGQLGARRFITQSMVFGYGFGDGGGRVLTEADPFAPPSTGRFEARLAALRANEEQVLAAEGLDGIALRYGQLYGPGPASSASAAPPTTSPTTSQLARGQC